MKKYVDDLTMDFVTSDNHCEVAVGEHKMKLIAKIKLFFYDGGLEAKPKYRYVLGKVQI